MPLEASFRSMRSFNAALDALADAVAVLGFDAVDYAFMPQARTPDGGWNAPDIASRNLPRGWRRGWSRFCRDDPYLWSCYRGNLPLDWQEVKDAAWLSDTQRQAIAYIDGLGFPDGLTVPIHLAGGSFAFVSALSAARQGCWRAAPDATKEQVFMLAHRFHATVADQVGLDRRRPALALSPRERDVLHHAADGLRASESAQLLGRSVETVRRQRKAAMAKLNARTIAQAVARAAALGLIAPPAA